MRRWLLSSVIAFVFLTDGLAQNLPQSRKVRGGIFSFVGSFVFAPDNKSLVIGEHRDLWAEIKVQYLDGPGSARSFGKFKRGKGMVALSPDGRLFAVDDEKNTVSVGDLAAGTVLKTLPSSTFPIQKLVFSPDGKRVAAATGLYWGKPVGQGIVVYDIESGQMLHDLLPKTVGTFPIKDVAFSPDGRLMVAGGGSADPVRVWDLQSGKEVSKWPTVNGRILAARFTPDGKNIVTAGESSEITFRDAASGEVVKALSVAPEMVNDLDISSDGRWLSVATSERWGKYPKADNRGQLRMWDLQSGLELKTGVVRKYGIGMARFSSDGRRLAWVANDWGDLMLLDLGALH